MSEGARDVRDVVVVGAGIAGLAAAWTLRDRAHMFPGPGIRDTMLADLREIFPETRGIIEEVLVQRWTHTVPYASPGRHLVQEALETPVHGSIFLAGDYIGAWTDTPLR